MPFVDLLVSLSHRSDLYVTPHLFLTIKPLSRSLSLLSTILFFFYEQCPLLPSSVCLCHSHSLLLGLSLYASTTPVLPLAIHRGVSCRFSLFLLDPCLLAFVLCVYVFVRRRLYWYLSTHSKSSLLLHHQWKPDYIEYLSSDLCVPCASCLALPESLSLSLFHLHCAGVPSDRVESPLGDERLCAFHPYRVSTSFLWETSACSCEGSTTPMETALEGGHSLKEGFPLHLCPFSSDESVRPALGGVFMIHTTIEETPKGEPRALRSLRSLPRKHAQKG